MSLTLPVLPVPPSCAVGEGDVRRAPPGARAQGARAPHSTGRARGRGTGERRSLQATGGSELFERCERRKRRERGSVASGGSGAERRDVVGGAERSRERRAYRESNVRKDRAAQRAAR